MRGSNAGSNGIVNRIRRLRFEHGEITREELARRAGGTLQTIIALEGSKYTPSLELAFRIAHAFGVAWKMSSNTVAEINPSKAASRFLSQPATRWYQLKGTIMISAVILINAAQGRVPEVAQALIDLNGITEAYSVAGPYDLVAIARVRQHDELEDLVAGRVQKIPGIESTNTLIAFRAYSQRDLEAMWDIGNEEPAR